MLWRLGTKCCEGDLSSHLKSPAVFQSMRHQSLLILLRPIDVADAELIIN